MMTFCSKFGIFNCDEVFLGATFEKMVFTFFFIEHFILFFGYVCKNKTKRTPSDAHTLPVVVRHLQATAEKPASRQAFAGISFTSLTTNLSSNYQKTSPQWYVTQLNYVLTLTAGCLHERSG